MKTPEEIFTMAKDDIMGIMVKFETYTEIRSYLTEMMSMVNFNQYMKGAQDAFIRKEGSK